VSKQRMIETSVWTNSKRFRKLDVVQKLLYLFLISNPQHSLCGAYEMFDDDIAHLTGIDERNLPHVFAALEREGLASYVDGWVVIHHYKVRDTNASVQTRVEKDREKVPGHILDILDSDSLLTACEQTARHLDLDLDSNLDLKRESAPVKKTRYDNLADKYGKAVVDDYLERVTAYEESSGKKYKNRVAAVANWLKRDEVKPKPKVSNAVQAPPRTWCPVCEGNDVKQNIDEIVCRDCGRWFKWDGSSWQEVAE